MLLEHQLDQIVSTKLVNIKGNFYLLNVLFFSLFFSIFDVYLFILYFRRCVQFSNRHKWHRVAGDGSYDITYLIKKNILFGCLKWFLKEKKVKKKKINLPNFVVKKWDVIHHYVLGPSLWKKKRIFLQIWFWLVFSLFNFSEKDIKIKKMLFFKVT